PYLPDSILWRSKEQFSDGVGYRWIDTLRTHAANLVTDQMLSSAAFRFPHNTPQTKEAYFYRQIFHEHFGRNSSTEHLVLGGSSIACSTPIAIKWNEAWSKPGIADPSGRAVDAHHSAYVRDE
ncbi:MAG: asparagine synthase-related protein, partial [archaeon]|nr:asparagine synthase-related protein [archaeon]